MHTFLVVGSISVAAREELQGAQVTIEPIHLAPALFLVGLQHQEWYRAHDGNEYQDLEMEDGRLVVRSLDLELAYDRRPYDVSQTSITSIYERRGQ